MAKSRKRVGLLTGGGDCPGLNAVIRAVVKTAYNEYNTEIIGFTDGYEGLILNKYSILSDKDVSGILTQGGTVLGTSNRANPFNYPVLEGDKYVYLDRSSQCVLNFESLGLEGIIAIGGDGTMAASAALMKRGIPIIGVPKTIDNDLVGTDITFGFDTAVQTATEAIDRIHTTAQSHHRVMIIEVMGRYAGWLALGSGLAGGGDIILIPEIPYDLQAVCEKIKRRNSRGKNFSIIVVGEGAKPAGGDMTVNRVIENSPDKIRLGGVSNVIATQIEGLINIECRVTILGHLVRGGSPSSFDRILATRLGCEATKRASLGEFGCMIGVHGQELGTIPIGEVAGKTRLVTPNHPWVLAAQSIGLCLGTPDDISIEDYLANLNLELRTVASGDAD